MKEKLTVLICMAVALTIAAFAQVEQPTSQPIDPVRAEVLRLASADPVRFDATMVAVSETLSDEEFGRYSRLYKANFQGNDLIEKLGNAYDGSPITAHAMQAAALSMLQAEIAEKSAELQALNETAAAMQEEFGRY